MVLKLIILVLLILLEYVVDYFNKNIAAKSELDMDFVVSFSEKRCVNPCTLLVAMIYVERLQCSVQQMPTASDHTAMCCRDSSELFVMALVLATKFLNDGGLDEFVWNDEFADASNFSTARINKLELELLHSLVNDCFIVIYLIRSKYRCQYLFNFSLSFKSITKLLKYKE